MEREKLKRREKIRHYVRKHREKKRVKENFIKAAASTVNGVDVSNNMLIEESRSGPPTRATVSFDSEPDPSTSTPVIIKFDFEKGKKTRKRSARSTANAHKIAKQLTNENAKLKRMEESLRKMTQRARKRDTFSRKSRKNTSEGEQPDQQQAVGLCENNGIVSLTPRRKMVSEMRQEGISPARAPKLKKKLLLNKALIEGIKKKKKSKMWKKLISLRKI